MTPSPPSMLLVEDEEAHVELIRRAFDRRGSAVRLDVARSLREAREHLAGGLPDLALLDLELPDGRGVDLLADLGEPPPLPVVIMTAQGDEQVAAEAIKAGALDYVVKSIDSLRDMPHIVEQALRQWRVANEKKELEHQLRQVQKLETLGTLAGGMAHDFSNILTSIQGFARLSQHRLEDEHPVQVFLDRIVKATGRAKELVDQILLFSGRGEQRRRPVPLQPVVTEVVELLRPTLPDSFTLRTVIDRCSPVRADPTQIHQVVMNLCNNARHAMGEIGGVLEVTLEEVAVDADFVRLHPGLREVDGRCVRLAVSDDGQGMPPELCERIFEPFFTTKPLGEGTGLGLAVVHGIVHGHGGVITVDSEPGRGTRFEVYLPPAEPEEPEEPGRAGVAVSGSEAVS